MNDIFISYASEDRAKAKVLADALERQGWTVWWDRIIPAGRTFDEVIEDALDAAKTVIVLWSEKSVKSRWVRTEAQEGADRKILIPVLIEKVRIPLAFRRIQAADLIGWDGSYTASFQGLVGDIAALLGPPPKEQEKRKQAEEERKQAEAEAEREEEEKRKQAEAEAKRKTEEKRQQAEEKRQQAEAEAKRKAEEERQQAEAEAKRKAEEEQQQAEAEARRKDVVASELVEIMPTSEPIPDGLDHTKPTGLETKKAWSRNQKIKVLAAICIVTLIAIISIGIFWGGPKARNGSIDDIPDDEMTWVICINKSCNAQYEMGMRAYYNKINAANPNPMGPTQGLACEKCQEPSVYKAEKCQNPDCGIVFRSGSIPNDLYDRCPKCKQSATEESRKARKRENLNR